MMDSRTRIGWRIGFLFIVVTGLTGYARGEFKGEPITVKVDGGWCWFQQPRAIIDHDQIIAGSVTGVAGEGPGGKPGDICATSYNLTTHAAGKPFVLANLHDHDDHAAPAFVALPDGRILACYENHGRSNYVYWRVTKSAGDASQWGPQQKSLVNVVRDRNGNTYNNLFYLSVPDEIFDGSRAIGYDPNFSLFSQLNDSIPTFKYGGHWMYWVNPNTGRLKGGDGRPYVKFASNGRDTVWFAATEDSPDNYDNSLYVGYIKFDAKGAGEVFTSTGKRVGPLSTGVEPAGGNNPPEGGNNGDLPSGSGKSYLPMDFTTVLQADSPTNGMKGKAVSWASSMELDSAGNPYIGIVVRDNLNDAVGKDLEYYYARFDGSRWQVHRIGYAGTPLYHQQPNYAGLIAVDPRNPDRVFLSANVNPATDASLAHYQIFEGRTGDGGKSWKFRQITDTDSENIRPIIIAGGGHEALLWMQGQYTSYTHFATNIVGLVDNAPAEVNVTKLPLGLAYTDDSVNADVFRVSAVASAGGFQFVTYYAPDGHVVVGRRKLGTRQWDLVTQPFKGNVRDAHDDVVLGISSDGIVHLAYNHHGSPLHYRVSERPYDVSSFGPEKPMTGKTERHVTYPQFINGPDGAFYFFYRDGASGNGSLCLNRYDAASKTWKALYHPLIDGENKCNPYWWRPAIGADGSIHLAWCWRETGNAETNHDLCYARSNDGGQTWVRSDGKPQALPITQENAEVVQPIAQGSNLINQCSSAVDLQGHPHLVQYFNDHNGIPQYFDVWFDGAKWHESQISHRHTGFSLSGGGSLAIPISRPEVAIGKSGTVYVITRDSEAGGGIRMYESHAPFKHWKQTDIGHEDLGNWEPTYDLARMRTQGILSLFVLPVEQGNHERTTHVPPRVASIWEWPAP